MRLHRNKLNTAELQDGDNTFEVEFFVIISEEQGGIGHYECHGFVGFHQETYDVIDSWDIVSIKKYNADGEQVELLNTDADRVDLLLERQLEDFEVVE